MPHPLPHLSADRATDAGAPHASPLQDRTPHGGFPLDGRPARIAALLAGLALALSAGCGRPSADYGDVGMAQVSGKVTLDEKPLNGAVVRFYDAGGRGRYAYGQTDASGFYTLQFNSEAAGALPGEKDVVISTAATGPEVKGGGGPERVPVRYNRDTELTRNVEPDGLHTFNFTLTSEGEIAEPPMEEGNEDAPGGD